ncbi:hypothetical protein Q3G72_002678 [Acer saccharum]|nr:hypothetical protein Q3G72_002678 [Acer saccharum]
MVHHTVRLDRSPRQRDRDARRRELVHRVGPRPHRPSQPLRPGPNLRCRLVTAAGALAAAWVALVVWSPLEAGPLTSPGAILRATAAIPSASAESASARPRWSV